MVELPSPSVKPGSFNGALLPSILSVVPSYEIYLYHVIQAIAPDGPAKILIMENAPDSELINMMNDAFKDLGLQEQHYGYLLKEAEKKLAASGFQKIEYKYAQGYIDFGSLQGDERISSAANLLSRVWVSDKAIQTQLEERLKQALKIQFLFNSTGVIQYPMVILVAERV